MLNLSSRRLRSACTPLAVCVLAAVVVPIAASTQALAQDWIVDDNPEFYDETGDYSWFTPPANINSHGYGTNGFRFTIAIGNDPREMTDSWAQWDIGYVNGIYEIEVWIPSAWATANTGYEIWEDSSRIDTAWINQQNVSGWQPLGTYDLGGHLRVSVYDAVTLDDYRTVGIANARLAVDALRMRRVDVNPQPTPPPPPPPPSTTPDAPRNLSLVLTDADSFHIDWDPPSDDGGSPITEYGVAVQHAGSGDIAGWFTAGTSTSFDGVVGATYIVEVWAKNSQGNGPAQRAQITIPSTGNVPGPPRNLSLTRTGSSGVRITWDAPADDGGSRVTRYSLSVWRPDGSTNSWTTTSTEYQFRGEIGAFYTVSVIAENRHGPSIPARESIYIEPDEPTPPPPDSDDDVPPVDVPPVMDGEGDQPQVRPPGPPRNLRLTLIDDDSFRITWDPPSDDGGAPVTGYTLEVSRPRLSSSIGPWSGTYTPRGRSFTIDGRRGAIYTVRVAARNRDELSSSVSGTIATSELTPPEPETRKQDDSSTAPPRTETPGWIQITEIYHDVRTFEKDPVTVTWTSDENATHYELAWWVARTRSKDPLDGRDWASIASIKRATELVCCERFTDVHRRNVRPSGFELVMAEVSGEVARPPTSYTIQGPFDGIENDKWILGKLLFTVRAINERNPTRPEGPWSDGEPPLRRDRTPIEQRPATAGRGLPAAECKADTYRVQPSDIIAVATLMKIIPSPGSTVIKVIERGIDAIWRTIQDCGPFWKNLWDGIKESFYLDKIIEALDSVRCFVHNFEAYAQRLAHDDIAEFPYILCGKLYTEVRED